MALLYPQATKRKLKIFKRCPNYFNKWKKDLKFEEKILNINKKLKIFIPAIDH